MKKNLFLSLLFVIGAMTYVSCDKADNPAPVNPDEPDIEVPDEPSELETRYFSIEDARYIAENFPLATIEEFIQGLNVNLHAIKGGTNLIQVSTEKGYTEFYIGAKNVPGYFLWTPSAGRGQGEGGGGALTENDLYKIAILFSTLLDDELTLVISAKDANNDVTKPMEIVISFVETKTEVGDLNVNLFFSNDKDVDLHLILPDGTRIFYGNRGGSYEAENGEIKSFGLDLDSNPACNIDGIRNENIFIPAQLVQNGTYTVQVDMYANCNYSLATDWQVIARYNDELLTNESADERFAGRNPVMGIYPAGVGNGDHTPVMQFTITNAEEHSVGAPRLIRSTFKPTPLKDTDWAKLSDEEYEAAVKREQK